MNAKFLTLTGLMAWSLAFAAGAAEPSTQGALQQKVSVGDLDLTTATGHAVLQRRIALAARNVCKPLDGRSLTQKRAFGTCVERASENAFAQLWERTPENAIESASAPAAERETSLR